MSSGHGRPRPERCSGKPPTRLKAVIFRRAALAVAAAATAPQFALGARTITGARETPLTPGVDAAAEGRFALRKGELEGAVHDSPAPDEDEHEHHVRAARVAARAASKVQTNAEAENTHVRSKLGVLSEHKDRQEHGRRALLDVGANSAAMMEQVAPKADEAEQKKFNYLDLDEWRDYFKVDKDDLGVGKGRLTHSNLLIYGIVFGSLLLLVIPVLVWKYKCGAKPFQLCPCFAFFLPSSMHHIQDVDHLVLIFCLLCALVALGMTIWHIIVYADYIFCGIMFAFLLPIMSVVFKCVNFYDSKLLKRRLEIDRQKQEISTVYQNMLEDLQAKLKAAEESNAGLSEQIFMGRKRDFVRYLEWLAELDEPHADLAWSQNMFIRSWLWVFQETSVDPITDPRVGTPIEFSDMVEATGDFVKDTHELAVKLKDEDVRFIGNEREKLEAKMKEHKATAARDGSRRKSWKKGVDTWREKATGATEEAQEEIAAEKDAVHEEVTGGGYPKKCCCCTLQSGTHLVAVLFTPVTPLLFAFSVLDSIFLRPDHGEDAMHISLQVGLLGLFVSLCCILRGIERIDKVMMLNAEIAALEAERCNLIDQRTRVSAFFGETQTLVDLWTYRTVPLLDLYHEVHDRIRDSYKKDEEGTCKETGRCAKLLDELWEKLDVTDAWMMVLTEHVLDIVRTHTGEEAPTETSLQKFMEWVRDMVENLSQDGDHSGNQVVRLNDLMERMIKELPDNILASELQFDDDEGGFVGEGMAGDFPLG